MRTRISEHENGTRQPSLLTLLSNSSGWFSSSRARLIGRSYQGVTWLIENKYCRFAQEADDSLCF